MNECLKQNINVKGPYNMKMKGLTLNSKGPMDCPSGYRFYVSVGSNYNKYIISKLFSWKLFCALYFCRLISNKSFPFYYNGLVKFF